MKAFSRFTVLTFISAAFLSAALGQSRSKTSALTADLAVQKGKFEGKLYTNGSLGFSMLVPGGWNIFTEEQNNASLAAGQANTLSNAWRVDEKERERLNSSLANTQILFQATSRVNDSEPHLSRISCGVERLATPVTLENYVERNKRLVLLTSPTQLAKDIYSTKISGTAFSGFDVDGTANGKVFKQRYLVTIRNGFALFIVTTLWNNINDSVLDASIKTLKFERQAY